MCYECIDEKEWKNNWMKLEKGFYANKSFPSLYVVVFSKNEIEYHYKSQLIAKEHRDIWRLEIIHGCPVKILQQIANTVDERFEIEQKGKMIFRKTL